ncbi:hypothetical protein QBC37DRAFT_430753 [Rhypophila decipiens]|uniref:Uncharacterized protein n=1 Tax=Rhypophila decipiens TaxID=261697 RepID=A0AAN6Y2X1_9PEZI|nr:hypothetical protein QBC37DRAFT_430753 [Rhypophila decipiens]
MSTCKGLWGILGWNTWPSGIWTVCQAEAAKDFGIAMACQQARVDNMVDDAIQTCKRWTESMVSCWVRSVFSLKSSDNCDTVSWS